MMQINRIIIHHSATPRGTWDAIVRGHTAKGWTGVGYHFAIDSRAILVGRPVNRPGAHCRGHNQDSIGICLVGNHSIDLPEDEDLIALGVLTKILMKAFGIPADKVFRHSDLASTECPGKFFPWAQFKRSLDERT